jgi:hypothetical protein
LAAAGKKLLGCLKKRDLLNNDKTSRSELLKFGELYAEQGRLADAIDFYERAEHVDGLTQLRQRCIDQGDSFLVQRLTKILGDSLSPPESEQLGDNALSQGKLLFARAAYQQSDHPEKLAQVEKLIKHSKGEQTSDPLH